MKHLLAITASPCLPGSLSSEAQVTSECFIFPKTKTHSSIPSQPDLNFMLQIMSSGKITSVGHSEVWVNQGGGRWAFNSELTLSMAEAKVDAYFYSFWFWLLEDVEEEREPVWRRVPEEFSYRCLSNSNQISPSGPWPKAAGTCLQILFSLWDNSRVKSIGIIQSFFLSSRHSTLQKSLSGSTTTRTPSMGKKRTLTFRTVWTVRSWRWSLTRLLDPRLSWSARS